MNKPSNLKFLNPSTLPKSFGYSHFVEARGARTVYISGQVSLNAQGEFVGVNDFEMQARQVFTNLRLALEAAGLTFSHVAKLGLYVTDISHLPILRRVRDEFVNLEYPPASTLVQVAAFFRPEVMFEADAIAIADEPEADHA
jgi:enamine deaminase RidA (YjgF/YER057c/UK114 family)